MIRLPTAAGILGALALLLFLAGCGDGGNAAVDGGPEDLAASTDPPVLAIDSASFQLVSSERVGRTVFLYTYRVNVVNTGGDALNTRAVVSSSAATTVVTDGDVAFGDVAANGTVTSLDTFTIRQDRTVPFDPSQLTWTVAWGDATGTDSVVIDRSWVFLPGTGLTAQLGARILDANGAELPGIVTWSSSAPDRVDVSAGGLLTALAVGSAQVFAEVNGVRSAPALVAVAVPVAGALLVTDAQVVAVGPPLGVIQDQPQAAGTQYEVTLQGVAAPAVGTVVLAAETAAVAGRVVASRQDAAGLIVTLELRPIYELFADYGIDWEIDLSAFPLDEILPAETAAAALAETAAGRVRAHRVTTSAFELEPFRNLECDGSIKPQLISSPLNLAPSIGLTLAVIDQPGHQKRALQGTASLSGTASLKLRAGFSASGKCEAKAQIRIPVTGWASVLVMPAVRFGVGAELAGQVIAVESELGATGTVGLSGVMGFECGGATPECRSLDDISGINNLRTLSSLPSADQMRALVSAQLYALAGLDLSFLLGAANAEIVDAKVGPKQSFDLAFESDQATRGDYASSYDLKLEAVVEPGSALAEAIKLAVDDDSTSVSFKAEASTDISESPKGTFSVDKANARPGEVVTFRVALQQPTTEYFLLGYNVDSVELYRRRSGEVDFEPFRTFPFASGGQSSAVNFEYQWTPEGLDAGENEFAAFVNTQIPTPLLEVQPVQKVTVSCFGPQGAASRRVRAAAARGRVTASETNVCADTWVGTWSGVQNGLQQIDSSMTWVLDDERMADPNRPPLQVFYRATGTVDFRLTVYEDAGCTVSPTSFSPDPPGLTSTNSLVVNYTTTPATYAMSGIQALTVTISCPEADPLEVPTSLVWFNGVGTVSEDGLTISGSVSVPNVGGSSWLLRRP